MPPEGETSGARDAGAKAGARPGDSGAESLSGTDRRLAALRLDHATRQATELTAIADMLGSRRRLLWTNFLAGLSRGVGFFLGVSLVGGLLVGTLAIFFERTAHTLGLHDFTLKKAVFSAYSKYDEVQRMLGEAQLEVERARQAAELATAAAAKAERAVEEAEDGGDAGDAPPR